jgi:hypothetical protein
LKDSSLSSEVWLARSLCVCHIHSCCYNPVYQIWIDGCLSNYLYRMKDQSNVSSQGPSSHYLFFLLHIVPLF